jgi:predicted transcriptional regulator
VRDLKSENMKLEAHISKLKVIQDNANNLIKSLMATGDNFNEFSKSITENINHIDDTAHMLDTLLIKLKDSKFKEIDKNADGVISADEFGEWVDE